MTHTFNAPATILTGAGASKNLSRQILKIGGSRVLFVTDPYILSTGLIARMQEELQAAGILSAVYADVQPDPTVQNVRAGLEQLLTLDADVVVAVGGGSPIDAAKAIAIAKTNPEPFSQYMGYHKIPNAGVPLIAIPTTAGTGSEVTKVTVITDTEQAVKMMILDEHLMPTVALVDYELSSSMPAPLTAHVGVDTLTHAIEAYVSKKANGMTDPLALSCIDLVARHLYTAWNQPDHQEARAAMALAACQGGMAFSNSSVCLVHGMSRPLGIQFHLPHGLSNAILLPAVTRFSISGAPERYATIARTMRLSSGNDSTEAACMALVKELERFNQLLHIPSLRDCPDISRHKFESVLEKMALDALASGSPQNNPVVPTDQEIISLYEAAW